MNVACWLRITQKGRVAVSKNKPRTAANEVAIRIKLDLPEGLFTRPVLGAEIRIPREAATPPEITAEVIGQYQDAIAAITGLNVRVYIEPEENQDVPD